MKSTHSIRRIENGVVELDNGTKWRPDVMSASKVLFWSPVMDRVELEDSGIMSKMTNISKKQTIGVSKYS
jgi:hypothetical protein